MIYAGKTDEERQIGRAEFSAFWQSPERREWMKSRFRELEELGLSKEGWRELYHATRKIPASYHYGFPGGRDQRRLERLCEDMIARSDNLTLTFARDTDRTSGGRMRQIVYGLILDHEPKTFIKWRQIYEPLATDYKNHARELLAGNISPTDPLASYAYARMSELAKTADEIWYVWREQWKPRDAKKCVKKLYEIAKKRR